MMHTRANYATLEDWMVQEAIPFAPDAGPEFHAAVDKMMGLVGEEVELLGFGEALHVGFGDVLQTGEELLILRNRLFQRLVENHGYSAIAIESSFPWGPIVNDYVLGRGVEAYADVEGTGFSHGFGKLKANRDLVEWMRHYNADPAHDKKIQFYGFDSPTDMIADSPRHMLNVVFEYLRTVDAERVQEFNSRMDTLLGEDMAWENPDAALDPTQAIGRSEQANALRIEVEDLLAELHMRRPELVGESNASRYQEAIHYAAMVRQLLNYHALLAQPSAKRQARLLGIRDTIMADNLAYIATREQGRGKVLVFAHNSHLKRGVAQWQLGHETVIWSPVGAHLHERFGRRYAVIGSAVVQSPLNGIGQPEAGTLEARFAAAPGPGRFIPTHAGQGLPAEEIVVLPTRSGSQKNRSYIELLNPQSFTDFDWLAVLDTLA